MNIVKLGNCQNKKGEFHFVCKKCGCGVKVTYQAHNLKLRFESDIRFQVPAHGVRKVRRFSPSAYKGVLVLSLT